VPRSHSGTGRRDVRARPAARRRRGMYRRRHWWWAVVDETRPDESCAYQRQEDGQRYGGGFPHGTVRHSSLISCW